MKKSRDAIEQVSNYEQVQLMIWSKMDSNQSQDLCIVIRIKATKNPIQPLGGQDFWQIWINNGPKTGQNRLKLDLLQSQNWTYYSPKIGPIPVPKLDKNEPKMDPN